MNRVSGAVLVGFHGISIFGRSNIHCLVYRRIKGNELVLQLSTLWAGLRSGCSLIFHPFQCYYYRCKSLLLPLTLSPGCEVRNRRFRFAGLFTPTTHLFYMGVLIVSSSDALAYTRRLSDQVMNTNIFWTSTCWLVQHCYLCSIIIVLEIYKQTWHVLFTSFQGEIITKW